MATDPTIEIPEAVPNTAGVVVQPSSDGQVFTPIANQISSTVNGLTNMFGKASGLLGSVVEAAPVNPLAPGLGTVMYKTADFAGEKVADMANQGANFLDMIADYGDEMVLKAKAASGDMEAAGQLLRNTDTPQELLDILAQTDEFKTPEGKEFLDIAREDKEFGAALHAAITKDPSVVDALINRDPDAAEDFQLVDIVAAAKDPQQRAVLTDVLSSVARSPSDDLNFKYMTDIAAAAKDKDYKKLQELLLRANINNDMVNLGADPMQFVMDFINDPVGFADKIPTLFNLEGEQAQAVVELMRGVGGLVEAVIGGEAGYRAVTQHYFSGFARDTGNFFERLSGETDRKAALAEISDPVGDGVPSWEEFQQFRNVPEQTASLSDDNVDAQRKLFENGKAVETSSIGVTVGGPSYLVQNGIYTMAALGLVPEEETQKYGQSMANTLANRNSLSFSMVG